MKKEEIITLIQENNSSDKGIFPIVDVSKYVDKILSNAVVIPFYESFLKGIVAFYANDERKENAFLSLILVAPKAQGQAIGNQLLDFSIQIVRQKGFKNYLLEVLKSNERAIKLYQKKGFKIVGEREVFFIMNLSL
ncbi:MAG: GNAT family N-acetyltransferase [Flavobacteriaceae bacterium]|nr:GNAT family N-acetyltransferase [Flavobacteriaceae bacterium]